MSERVFISPSKYVQGKDVIDRLGTYVSPFGEKALVIADDVVWKIVKERVEHSLSGENVGIEKADFSGEASRH